MIEMPLELQTELKTMRRDPANFSVACLVNCSWCVEVRGAFNLTHPKATDAGTWCPVHGWKSFPSAVIEPERNVEKTTER